MSLVPRWWGQSYLVWGHAFRTEDRHIRNRFSIYLRRVREDTYLPVWVH